MIDKKECPRCGFPKDVDQFAVIAKTGRLSCWCHECRRAHSRLNGRKTKYECFMQYGGIICACCKDTNFEFLAIDHIDGGGNRHRREVSTTGNRLVGIGFYLWLKRNGWPPGFRVLCHNCNFSLGAFGYCPHSSPPEFSLKDLERKPINYAKGERVISSKMTIEKVVEMRRLRAEGATVRDLMRVFDMSKAQVHKICSGNSWSKT